MQQLYSLTDKRVWVTGHNGMVGSALVRRLQKENCEIVTTPRAEVDLTSQRDVQQWMELANIQAVFVGAAKVGGIHANSTYPADFLYDNLMIAANIIHAAYQNSVEKLLFLGSSCIYPRMAPQPISEDALLTGPLEPTNEWYAIAKIAGIKLCQAYRQQHQCDFISGMPTNLYGANDNFNPLNSHVPAALLSRFHQAKIENRPFVEIWGTGTPLREFLHADDLADACVFMMEHYSGHEHLNIGCGKEISIKNFAEAIKETVGYEGELKFDTTKPDGTPLKKLNVDAMTNLGWMAKTPLKEGLRDYYDWYLRNLETLRT